MKRVASFPPTEEKQESKIPYIDNNNNNNNNFPHIYVVVVEGIKKGFFGSLEDFKNEKAVAFDSIVNYFTSKNEALKWYNRSLCHPVYEIDAVQQIYLAVHKSDDEGFAAVGAYFGANDPRNFCVQAKCTDSNLLNVSLFKKVLSLIGEFPIQIICNSKWFVYGVKYGLWDWPKNTDIYDDAPTIELENICNLIKELGIELKVSKYDIENITKRVVDNNIQNQRRGIIPSFKGIQKIYLINQCAMWILCAKRMSMCKDIRQKIAKLVFFNPPSDILFY